MSRRHLPTSLAGLLLGLSVLLASCSGGPSTSNVPAAPAAPAQPASGTDASQSATRSRESGGLSRYNLDLNHIAVAGVSSGAMMAGQLHYTHSANVKYEAIFAGAPYYCAMNTLALATNCMLGILPEALGLLEGEARQFAASGWIDDTNNLRGSKGYYFSGQNDHVVATASVKYTAQELRDFGGTTTEDYSTQAGHTWPSPDGHNACSSTGPNWIDNCGIDPEQAFLSEFFGGLNPRNTGTLKGNLIHFDQNRYSPIWGQAIWVNMDSTGMVYVPADCAAGATCKLLVVIHGCLSSQIYIGTDLQTQGNVDKWADTNHIVVLYPQLWTGWSGCWDWYGYGGSNYMTKSGLQIETIWNMVQAL